MLAVLRTRHHYGDHGQQVGDLWRPDHTNGGDSPVVVLIHGGYWRARYTKRLMSAMAESRDLHGWAAWNIEYRRVGRFGGGGGWPATFSDVGAAIDHIRQLPGLDRHRVVTCGHSAGAISCCGPSGGTGQHQERRERRLPRNQLAPSLLPGSPI